MTLESVGRNNGQEITTSSYGHIQRAKPEVSIIIPVYNVESHIRTSIEYLQRVLANICNDYEMIVVNDGSLDNTSAVVKEAYLKDARIKLLSYTPNMGKGYAVKQGVLEANGENIVFIDGDCDVKPAVLASYIDALKHADLVVASKYHPDSRVRAPLLRKVLSFGFHCLVRLALGITIMDTQAGLKAGRSRAFKQIFTKVLVKRYAFDAEMLAVASLLGHRMVEMPIDIELNKQFKIKDIVRMFIDLAGIAYRLRILKWYQDNLNNDKPNYRPIIPI